MGWNMNDPTNWTRSPHAEFAVSSYVSSSDGSQHIHSLDGHSDPACQYFATQRAQHVFCIPNHHHVVKLWWAD